MLENDVVMNDVVNDAVAETASAAVVPAVGGIPTWAKCVASGVAGFGIGYFWRKHREKKHPVTDQEKAGKKAQAQAAAAKEAKNDIDDYAEVDTEN